MIMFYISDEWNDSYIDMVYGLSKCDYLSPRQRDTSFLTMAAKRSCFWRYMSSVFMSFLTLLCITERLESQCVSGFRP